MKKIIFCDMDNTLCESCRDISEEMKREIERVVAKGYVFVVIGGSKIEHICSQVCRHLNVLVYVLGNSGTKVAEWDGGKLKEIFSDDFDEQDKRRVIKELEVLSSEFNLNPMTSKEDQIQDRGTQITFSVLGRHAPQDRKKFYDVDKSKRKKFVEFLKDKLKDFELTIGGTTSIDITKKGRNKGWGIKNFCEFFDYSFEDCLFIGDGLFPGGNDYSVIGVIDCIKVNNLDETLYELRKL